MSIVKIIQAVTLSLSAVVVALKTHVLLIRFVSIPMVAFDARMHNSAMKGMNTRTADAETSMNAPQWANTDILSINAKPIPVLGA